MHKQIFSTIIIIIFINYYYYLICFSSYSVHHTTSNRGSYWHHVGSEPLFYKTLGKCVDKAAEKYGDREALVSLHEGLRFSFKDIQEKSNKLAAGFLSTGLKHGDRLGLWSPNYSHWYLTMIAAAKAGLVLVIRWIRIVFIVNYIIFI